MKGTYIVSGISTIVEQMILPCCFLASTQKKKSFFFLRELVECVLTAVKSKMTRVLHQPKKAENYVLKPVTVTLPS